MKVNIQHMTSVFLIFFLVLANILSDAEFLNVSTGKRSDEILLFNAWCDRSDSDCVQNQAAKPHLQKMSLRSPVETEINIPSMITKTYYIHNLLHYNIPLTCCKFSVSQFTCDG